LQDYYPGNGQQVEVCNASTVTVFNSDYTFSQYKDVINQCKIEIIPLGVDFQLFKKSQTKVAEILPHSLLFVGSSEAHPKGFDVVLNLISNTNYNFCLVMKDGFNMRHPRVKVFNRVPHDVMVRIYNSCDLLICTSVVETLHLAGIEAAACDVPVLATNVGVYFNRPAGEWGRVSDINEFVSNINYMISNRSEFSPRQYFLKEGFDKRDVMNKWKFLVESL
jgi:glycosyltransferase involved in cell wall biosynthesis